VASEIQSLETDVEKLRQDLQEIEKQSDGLVSSGSGAARENQLPGGGGRSSASGAKGADSASPSGSANHPFAGGGGGCSAL
jgi:TolA-binding protein